MQIKVKAYNEAPTAEELEKRLAQTGLNLKFEVADAERQYWQNDEATLVLRAKAGASLNFGEGVAIANLVLDFHVDEFHQHVEDYRTYYRIWWD